MEYLTYGLLNNTSKHSSSSGGFSLGGSNGLLLLIIIAIITFIAATLIFILVVERKKSFKSKFANWLKEFLNFRSIVISGIIKYVYVFSAIFLTIMSFVTMFSDGVSLESILTGLGMLIFGNIGLRIGMELTMSIIGMWENTSNIRLVLVKKEEKEENEVEGPSSNQPVEDVKKVQPQIAPQPTPPQTPTQTPPQMPTQQF